MADLIVELTRGEVLLAVAEFAARRFGIWSEDGNTSISLTVNAPRVPGHPSPTADIAGATVRLIRISEIPSPQKMAVFPGSARVES